MYHFRIYGSHQILAMPKLAIHASRCTPESLFSLSEKIFDRLAAMPIAVVGGWHSKLEKHLLKRYHKALQAKLAIFIAKKFEAFTLPEHLTNAFKTQQVMIIEPATYSKRLEEKGVEIRDQIIDDIIDHHLFLYIHPGGYLEKRFHALIKNEKYVYFADHAENESYRTGKVKMLNPQNVSELSFHQKPGNK